MKNKTTNQKDKAEIPLNKANIKRDDLQKEDDQNDPESKSELEKRKERTHKGSTKPDKDHIG